MDYKIPWEKIKSPFQKAATKFLSLPFQKKTGYFLLLAPALGIINFLIITRLATSATAILDSEERLNYFWLFAWEGGSSPIPIFLGLMAIAGSYLIKDK